MRRFVCALLVFVLTVCAYGQSGPGKGKGCEPTSPDPVYDRKLKSFQPEWLLEHFRSAPDTELRTAINSVDWRIQWAAIDEVGTRRAKDMRSDVESVQKKTKHNWVRAACVSTLQCLDQPDPPDEDE